MSLTRYFTWAGKESSRKTKKKKLLLGKTGDRQRGEFYSL
jgi:hypothetical protein